MHQMHEISLKLRANTTNALGAQQLHELIWAVTVNLAVISLEMHEMHQMHEICLFYAQILQMHQVHDNCTSYMTAVTVNLAVFLLKMHEMHQMHDSRVEGEPSQGTDIF